MYLHGFSWHCLPRALDESLLFHFRSSVQHQGTPSTMIFSDLPSSRLQNIGIGLEILFPILSVIVVALRIYARVVSRNFGWGEYIPTSFVEFQMSRIGYQKI